MCVTSPRGSVQPRGLGAGQARDLAGAGRAQPHLGQAGPQPRRAGRAQPGRVGRAQPHRGRAQPREGRVGGSLIPDVCAASLGPSGRGLGVGRLHHRGGGGQPTSALAGRSSLGAGEQPTSAPAGGRSLGAGERTCLSQRAGTRRKKKKEEAREKK
jgi:hypothetical protein